MLHNVRSAVDINRTTIALLNFSTPDNNTKNTNGNKIKNKSYFFFLNVITYLLCQNYLRLYNSCNEVATKLYWANSNGRERV